MHSITFDDMSCDRPCVTTQTCASTDSRCLAAIWRHGAPPRQGNSNSTNSLFQLSSVVSLLLSLQSAILGVKAGNERAQYCSNLKLMCEESHMGCFPTPPPRSN
jgi:hypothetical protein